MSIFTHHGGILNNGVICLMKVMVQYITEQTRRIFLQETSHFGKPVVLASQRKVHAFILDENVTIFHI